MGAWVGRADNVRGGHGGDECLLVERWSKWVQGQAAGWRLERYEGELGDGCREGGGGR